MGARTTLILLAAVMALGAFIYFFEARLDSTRTRQENEALAFRLDPDEVTRLRVEAGDLALECARREGQWRIVAPIQARAAAGELERLLTGMAHLPRLQVITPAQMKKNKLTRLALGLDPPAARVQWWEDSRQRALWIGRVAPVGAGLYVEEEDRGAIVVTETNLLQLLPVSVNQLRERTLFGLDPKRTRGLELRTVAGMIQLTRTEAGYWMLQQPLAARASERAVQRLIETLTGFSIERFVSDTVVNPDVYGLDEGSANRILLAGDGQTPAQELLLGIPDEKNPEAVYARYRSDSAVFTVPLGILEAMAVSAENLRDRRLVYFAPPTVSRIQAEESDRALDLELKADGRWWINKPVSWMADDQRIARGLGQVAGLRVSAFYSGPATNLQELGLAPPARVMKFSYAAPGTEGRAGDTNRVGLAETVLDISAVPRPGGRVLVRNRTENFIAETSHEDIRTYPLDALFYRDREVLRVATGEVVRVTRQAAGSEVVLERNPLGRFQPVRPAGGTADASALAALLDAVSHLRCAFFVEANPRDLATYGLATPAATLELGLRGGAGLARAVLLGQPAGNGGVYAMIRGQDVVFVLDGPTRDVLLKNLLNGERHERANETTGRP